MIAMMKRTLETIALAAWMCSLSPAAVAGALSDNIRITSKYMGYDLQYRIYTPDGIEEGARYPVLVVTDGQLYVDEMGMVDIVDRLMQSGSIRRAFVVFVDSRNPDDLGETRRNSEFTCKAAYVNFHAAELLPKLIEEQPISAAREDTNILGLSFGAINSACFGALASGRYSGIGMHSPGSDKHVREIMRLYEKIEKTEPLRIFLSVGTINDNLRANRRLRDTLEEKGYEVTYVENKGRTHTFENWREMIDDALLALLPAGE